MAKFGSMPVKKKETIAYAIQPIVYEDGTTPTLQVMPANDSNKPYMSALLRNNAQVRRVPKVTLKTLARNRNDDIELYAKYIIKGWENVRDENDEQVKFSIDECVEFLEAIVKDNTWIFDDIRMFCSDMNNFIEDGADENDEEELLKN